MLCVPGQPQRLIEPALFFLELTGELELPGLQRDRLSLADLFAGWGSGERPAECCQVARVRATSGIGRVVFFWYSS